MLDSIGSVRLQRSSGRAFVSLAARNQQVLLCDLHQSGSAKAFLPRVAGRVPEIVFLNTAGGLTGGDRLDYEMLLGPGTIALATTQTAERAYASVSGAGQVRVSAELGAGAHLAWLPQETILFEDSHLSRETCIDLGPDATCLLAETVVLGRQAMGETLRHARLTDRRMVRRQGRTAWAETFRLDGGVFAMAESRAMLGGARAFAVLALIAPGAEDAVGRLRTVLDEPGCEAAASGWDGRCVARLLAPDGWTLRRQLIRAVLALRPGPLPRVWQN